MRCLLKELCQKEKISETAGCDGHEKYQLYTYCLQVVDNGEECGHDGEGELREQGGVDGEAQHQALWSQGSSGVSIIMFNIFIIKHNITIIIIIIIIIMVPGF